MNNFLVNVARRGAGIVPQLREGHSAAIRPVVPPVWRTEVASGFSHDRFEEQAWSQTRSNVDEVANNRRVVASVIPSGPSPELPARRPSLELSQDQRPASTSSPAAHIQFVAGETEPVTVNRYSATVRSYHPVDAGTETTGAGSGDDDDRQATAQPIFDVHPPIASEEAPKSQERSSNPNIEPQPEAKMSHGKAMKPDQIDLATPTDAGQKKEAQIAANPVVREQRVVPAPAISAVPHPRRDAPLGHPQKHAQTEQSSVLVKIGKVEVRASQPQRPVQASRPRGSSGFAEMALRRAHMDRNYR